MIENEHTVRLAAPLEIGLCVADLQRSLGFYRDVLGFRSISEIETPAELAIASGFANSGYRVVRLELSTGERLKLFAPDDPVEPAMRVARPLGRVGFAYLTLIVADIRASIDHLAAHGFPARCREPFALRDNVLVGLVEDPDGNMIELVQYLDLTKYRSAA